MKTKMASELQERFLAEIGRMSQKTLAKYRERVGNKIVDRILNSLTIDELKWLYIQINNKIVLLP